MKTSDLKVGTLYEIEYRNSIPKSGDYFHNPKLKGVGRLVKIDFRPGWHQFALKSNKRVVFASSRSVICASTDSLATVEEIIPKTEIVDEVHKLRKIGLDDDLRKEEVQALILFLQGLGVNARPDEDFTEITIKYLDITTLKAVLATVYKQALSID